MDGSQALRQGLTPAEPSVQLLYNSFFMMESWPLAGQLALPAAHCCAVSELLRQGSQSFLAQHADGVGGGVGSGDQARR